MFLFLDDSNILDHYLFIVTFNENDHIIESYIYSSSEYQHIEKHNKNNKICNKINISLIVTR